VQTRATRKRSIVKAITYRVVIVCLDFLAIYLLTGKVVTAAAFMVVSNIYTTAGYFLHERVWAGIRWGMEPQQGT
jgi:adenylylsulfate kinase